MIQRVLNYIEMGFDFKKGLKFIQIPKWWQGWGLSWTCQGKHRAKSKLKWWRLSDRREFWGRGSDCFYKNVSYWPNDDDKMIDWMMGWVYRYMGALGNSRILYFKVNCKYLKDGIGEPWAGQVKAKLVETMSANDNELIFEENFGDDAPAGSKIKGLKRSGWLSIPETWDRMPLSWTNQSHGFPKHFPDGKQFHFGWESWFSTSNGF